MRPVPGDHGPGLPEIKTNLRRTRTGWDPLATLQDEATILVLIALAARSDTRFDHADHTVDECPESLGIDDARIVNYLRMVKRSNSPEG